MSRKIAALAMAGLLGSFGTAQAADFEPERELGLIVSGVVDQWAGIQFIDGPEAGFGPPGATTDETVFVNGGEGLLSLPAGDNLSIQSDFKYEYNENALDTAETGDVLGPEYMFQGAFHLSWRDPSSGLFGFFGGIGEANVGELDTVGRFIGGEGQIYMGNLTFYAQGGYVDFEAQDTVGFGVATLEDGAFARGVIRWFPTADSRLQLEGTYIHVDYTAAVPNVGDMEAFTVKARYDFTLGGMPILGDVPLYFAYRGIFRDNCLETAVSSTDTDDHTIMVGTSYSFSGDRLTVDRQGATLDTPDFYHSCSASNQTSG